MIAGLDPKTFEPYVCNMDLIGCINEPEDFVVAGSCTEQLYGMCEALWEPNLKPDDLFETCAQALVNAFDRDGMSGWGAVVHIMYLILKLNLKTKVINNIYVFSARRTRSLPERLRPEWINLAPNTSSSMGTGKSPLIGVALYFLIFNYPIKSFKS